MQVANRRRYLGDVKGDGVFIEWRIFDDLVVEIALADLHHQIGLIFANVEAVSRQYVGMIAKEVDLALVDEEVQLHVLLPEGLHRQHNASDIRYGQQYLSCLAFAHPTDHLEFILWSLVLDLPHHLQGLVHLCIDLVFLLFFPEKFLRLGRLIARPRSHSPFQILEKTVVLPSRCKVVLNLFLPGEVAYRWRFFLRCSRLRWNLQFELSRGQLFWRWGKLINPRSNDQRLTTLVSIPQSIDTPQSFKHLLRPRLCSRYLPRILFNLLLGQYSLHSILLSEIKNCIIGECVMIAYLIEIT